MTEDFSTPVVILASLVGAVLSGLLLLKFLRPVVIVISSFYGGLLTWMILMVLYTFPHQRTESIFENDAHILTLLLALLLTPWILLGLFVAGVLFQFMTTRNEDLPRDKSSRKKKGNTPEYSSPYNFLHEKGS